MKGDSTRMSEPTASHDIDLDPTDPYAREAQTFPRLTSDIADRIAAYGTEERLGKGTFVFCLLYTSDAADE